WAGATAAAHLDRRKRSGTMSPGAGARHGWGTHAHRAAALAPDVGGDVCFARLCLLAFSGRGRHTAVDRLIDGVRPDHFGNGAAAQGVSVERGDRVDACRIARLRLALGDGLRVYL